MATAGYKPMKSLAAAAMQGERQHGLA